MAPENFSHKPPPARGSARWTAASSSPARPNRLAFRLIGIPVLAVAGVLLYSGLRDYFILPECDSARAKNTLADIFKQLKFEPQSLEPIKTISASKDQVVCNAALPLADGATLNVDIAQGGAELSNQSRAGCGERVIASGAKPSSPVT
jgi:hypothetical protein